MAVRDEEPVYGALDSLSDLFNMLQRAATIGKEELDKVLADSRVDALIQSANHPLIIHCKLRSSQ